MSYYRLVVLTTVAGLGLGFFVIQPLIVLVYNLAPKNRLAFHELSFWTRWLDITLNSTSLFMGATFAILGGLTGLSFGSWLYHRDCLSAEKNGVGPTAWQLWKPRRP